MKRTTAIGLVVLSLFAPAFFVQSLAGARAARPRAAAAALENGTLSLRIPEPGSAVLTNKLTARSYALSAEPFVLLLEIAGNRFRAAAGDAGRAPQRIGRVRQPDQGPDLEHHCRPPDTPLSMRALPMRTLDVTHTSVRPCRE